MRIPVKSIVIEAAALAALEPAPISPDWILVGTPEARSKLLAKSNDRTSSIVDAFLRQPVCTFYLHFGEGENSARNVAFFLPQRIGESRLTPDSSGCDGVTFPTTKPMVGIGNASARALRRKACIKPTSESFLVARSGEPRFQRLPSHRLTLPACTKQTAGAFVTNAGVKIPVMLCSLLDDARPIFSIVAKLCARSECAYLIDVPYILRRSPAFTLASTCLQLRPYGKRDR